jgi:phage terminase large subunit-like protein
MRSKKTGPDLGDQAVARINQLTHTKGRWAGKPFDLRPWQAEIIHTLFGRCGMDSVSRCVT